MAQLVEAYRSILYYHQMPDFLMLGIWGVLSIVLISSAFNISYFLTRLLLCSAIRVNSIALAYRNNSQIF